ncbi:hypothetical protein ACFOG5_05860 [Pedobacter fastidiosus]|uniref:HMA domain-containing protein n=1 Tax=Pedobacter fastidiosus TaxID=2765361 RepID=A0ABR7KRJ2_9SPHI|nr:hypothetical protein [Pedobacter fastidiosus]MBC6110333.1 hypothetical protein [Pedobacter fastidiosus]
MISIFKTNIQSENELQKIASYLNARISEIIWNIDLLDSDKILRIDSNTNKNEEVISLFNEVGYRCTNLETFYAEPV